MPLRGGEFFLLHDLEGPDFSYTLHKSKIDVSAVMVKNQIFILLIFN